jgi:hypothetical protein
MPELPSLSTSAQEWIKARAEAVRKKYTAFQCLHEHGHGEHLVDEDTPVSIFCPYHANVNTMAARYYPASGRKSDYVRCFRCHENWDALNLYLKFKGVTFMDALRELERRFNIKVDRRPEEQAPEPLVDKSSSKYESEAWGDVPRVLLMLEEKLGRLRARASLHEYVRFCRVLDSVSYDLNRAKGEQTDEMVEVLGKLRQKMDLSLATELVMSEDGLS